MQIRMPKETKEKLEKLSKITLHLEFLREVTDLFINYYEYEGYKPVKFSETDGKPVKYKWVLTSKFNNWVIYTHKGFNSVIKLTNEIYEFINDIRKTNTPFIYEYKGEQYMITKYRTSYNRDYVDAGVFIEKIAKNFGSVD